MNIYVLVNSVSIHTHVNYGLGIYYMFNLSFLCVLAVIINFGKLINVLSQCIPIVIMCFLFLTKQLTPLSFTHTHIL